MRMPRLPRRVFSVAGASLVLIFALTFTALVPTSALAADSSYVGYSGPNRVYFPQTGHHLGLGFLSFWMNNGGLNVFGYPITDEIQRNGLTVQYFERAVLEYHPEAPAAMQIQLRRLGALAQPQMEAAALTKQWQMEYLASVGDFSMPVVDPFTPVAAIQENGDHRFFPQTGHTLNYAFKSFWEMNGGTTVFGYPLSEEYADPATGLTIQVFERAVLEWHPDAAADSQVQIERLGVLAAQQDGVDTSPVTQAANVPVYDASLFHIVQPDDPAALTTPLPGAPLGKDKWIEVDLTRQYLRAWEGTKVVFQQYISAGLSDTPTPVGYFQVYIKLPFDEMTNGPKPPPGEALYDLKNVPNVMYFLQGGYAIHGAYWHADFGTPISHGCVNMTLDGAAWLYQWTPLGTEVWIHN